MYISDRDRRKEKEIRRMDVYSFYFMIATEARKNKAKPKLSEEFGHKPRTSPNASNYGLDAG